MRRIAGVFLILILCFSIAGCDLFVPKYVLNVDKVGEGSVDIDPLEEKYAANTEITLTAVPHAKWYFSHWEGDVEATEAQIVITIEKNMNIIAVFERQDFPLNIDKIGQGEVEIIEVIEPQAGEFPYETIVRLRAVPAIGWEFSHWQGDVEGTEAEVEIEIDEEKNVTAVFYELARVPGYITHTRGGPPVANAKVSSDTGGEGVYTDNDGYFELFIEPDVECNLYVEADGYARGKVQEVLLGEGAGLEIEFPLRSEFNPDWSLEPPQIYVTGVERGATVSGELTITVEIESDNDIFVHYVYFGGRQRTPIENVIEVGADKSEVVIDTSKYPNGESYIRVLAYDYNQLSTLFFVPVVIDNGLVHVGVPEDIPVFNAFSTTFGINFGYYSDRRAELFEKAGIEADPYILETNMGDIIDLQSLEEGYSIYAALEWASAPDAIGYSIYRSFDGENFTHIGDVSTLYYTDFSPLLEADKQTYYKVVPYNSYGQGEAIVRTVTPLPSYNVFLETPANEATGVDLQPTFKWDIEVDGEFSEMVYVDYDIWVWEATWQWVWYDMELNEKEIAMPFQLQPGTVYTWDIFYSEASIIYENEADGYSYAVSIAGDGYDYGALNGEFIFTTTTEVE